MVSEQGDDQSDGLLNSAGMKRDVVVCVDPEKLDHIWPHVKLFLQAAYIRGSGDDDLESLKRDLDDKKALLWVGSGDDNLESLKRDLDEKKALLWVVWDGSAIIAGVVTKLIQTPTKFICVVAACGDKEMNRWVGCIADLEDYAKTENCDEMRVMGREGWARMLPEYHVPWVTLAKRLK
jgi:hypothetical protein